MGNVMFIIFGVEKLVARSTGNVDSHDSAMVTIVKDRSHQDPYDLPSGCFLERTSTCKVVQTR
jgi:hypothetical protein